MSLFGYSGGEAMRTSECDIVIAGVGGQGVILLSDVIGRAAVKAGKPVRGAETHGMAQRGGSVINHTRIGCSLGPMVASGSADVLLALEPAEGLRFGHFIAPWGTALVNIQPVLPITVTAGMASYPPVEEILAHLRSRCRDLKAIDASGIAVQAGTVQALNVVMLGALSRFIPLEEHFLLEALKEVVPPRHWQANQKAFGLGKAEVE
jgi:indolepyruvate ferredoxin oxidoreductase beta subunit